MPIIATSSTRKLYRYIQRLEDMARFGNFDVAYLQRLRDVLDVNLPFAPFDQSDILEVNRASDYINGGPAYIPGRGSSARSWNRNWGLGADWLPSMVPLKRCNVCFDEKPKDIFDPLPSGAPGRTCQVCVQTGAYYKR